MKKLFYGLIMIAATKAFGYEAVSNEKMNWWIEVSLSVTAEKILAMPGAITCSPFTFDGVSSIHAHGKNKEEAAAYAAMLCIQDQCAHINERISAKTRELAKLDPEILAETVEAMGLPPEKAELALRRAKGSTELEAAIAANPASCHTGSEIKEVEMQNPCLAETYQLLNGFVYTNCLMFNPICD